MTTFYYNRGLLSLFADDATIYEPFSNISEGLQGKNAIKSFLEVTMMANDGLQYEIEFEKGSSSNGDSRMDNCKHKKSNNISGFSDNNSRFDNQFITALITFEKGESIQAQFTFELDQINNHNKDNNNSVNRNRNIIKSLHIQFVKN